MANVCIHNTDFIAEGILADKVVLGSFKVENNTFPALGFVTEEGYVYAFIKEIEYITLKEHYTRLLKSFETVANIISNADKSIYDKYLNRKILCTDKEPEFYSLDIDYLNKLTLDTFCI